MIFECEFKEQYATKQNVTIMLLRTPNGNGYLVIYDVNSVEKVMIKVYKVVGGRMKVKCMDYLVKEKWLAEPEGVLYIRNGYRSEKFRKTSHGYELVYSTTRISTADFTNFTLIDDINPFDLKVTYSKLKLQNIHLDCTWVGIPDVINDRLNHDSITTLVLRQNGLTSIPKQIRYLTNLRKLDVSFNKIVVLDDELFTTDSGIINTLKEFILNNNQINNLPSSFFNLKNIEEVFVNHNSLVYLSHEIRKLSKLKEIGLSNNYLVYLPDSILKIPSLQSCFFDANVLYKTDKAYVYVTSKHKDIPSEYDAYCNIVYRDHLLSELHPSMDLMKQKTIHCECSNESFKGLQEVLVNVTNSNFKPNNFPVEVLSCSKQCLLNQICNLGTMNSSKD